MLILNRRIALFTMVFLVYGDLIKVLKNIISSSLEEEGIFLFGPGTEQIKQKVWHVFSNSNYNFMLYGNGIHQIPCNKIRISSNNIFLHYIWSSKEIEPCLSSHIGNIFTNISIKVDIPFYMRLLGHEAMHFEVVGNYFNISKYLPNSVIQSLPIDSTIIITAPTEHTFGSVSFGEEVLINGLYSYTRNSYLKYIYYLTINPAQNIFFSTSKTTTILAFNVSVDNTLHTTSAILAWQRKQIMLFHKVVLDTAEGNLSPALSEFDKEVIKYLRGDLASAIFSKQLTNVERYKDLMLLGAVIRNDQVSAIKYLEAGFNPNAKLWNNATALHLVSKSGNMHLAETLIKFGVNINSIMDTGMPALFVAVHYAHMNLIELLLLNGANISLTDAHGKTPLLIAAAQPNTEILKILVEHHADINHINSHGESALSTAVKSGYYENVQFLLNEKAMIKNMQDLIFTAINNFHFEVATLLLNHFIITRDNSDFKYGKDECPQSVVLYLTEYILDNSNDPDKGTELLENLISYAELREEKLYLTEIINCLYDLDTEKSYINLSGLCASKKSIVN